MNNNFFYVSCYFYVRHEYGRVYSFCHVRLPPFRPYVIQCFRLSFFHSSRSEVRCLGGVSKMIALFPKKSWKEWLWCCNTFSPCVRVNIVHISFWEPWPHSLCIIFAMFNLFLSALPNNLQSCGNQHCAHQRRRRWLRTLYLNRCITVCHPFFKAYFRIPRDFLFRKVKI